MIEPTVKLTEEAWQRVLQILANAPWSTANPLIMAIGQQLAAQAPPRMPSDGAGETSPSPATRQ